MRIIQPGKSIYSYKPGDWIKKTVPSPPPQSGVEGEENLTWIMNFCKDPILIIEIRKNEYIEWKTDLDPQYNSSYYWDYEILTATKGLTENWIKVK